MADFKTQVEGLTGLSIGTSPTNDELSQFLVDGTKEVINRITALNPFETSKFCVTTNSTTNVTKTGKILSVMREHDSTTILRKCDQIDPHDRYNATDSDSLHYRSKHNPGWYELDGKIYSVPTAAGSDNDIVVTQVSYATNTGHSSTAIQDFPNEYEYLVVLYGAIKSLQNALSSIDNDLPSDLSAVVLDTSAVSLPTYAGPSDFVLPVPPSGVDVDFSEAGTVETFVMPVFNAPTLSTSALEYNAPVMGDLNYTDANTWINTEEDSEMLESRITEITAKINEFEVKVANSQSEFEKNNTIYQKEINEWAQDYQGKLSEYQVEVQKETQRITSSLQDYQAKVSKALQKYQAETGYDITKYQSEVQANINKFQSDLTKASTDFQNDLAGFSANVEKVSASNSAKIGKYQADVQNYINKVQKNMTKYEWMQGRLGMLSQQYTEAFSIMAPRQQQGEQ